MMVCSPVAVFTVNIAIGNARLLALQQPHFLGLGESQRLAVLAGGRVVGVESRIARALLELIGAFGIHA